MKNRREMYSRRLLWITISLMIIFPINSIVTAQHSSNRNVTPGSFIVANAAATAASLTWTTSPSGEFAFGFKQVTPGGFLLGIWFDQIPEKTLVWSANRDNPVPSGSRAQLSEVGELELIDERGRRVWDPNGLTGAGRVAYGAMLDTGNFVLRSNSSTRLWQSFDTPTDTLLPGQTLNVNDVLVSSFSDTNYSRGRFKLTTGAVLGLYTRNFPWDDTIYPYWLDGPGFQLIFNESGHIYRTADNRTSVNSPFKDAGRAVPVEDFVQRLTLEYDGVFRHYVYPKSAKSAGGHPLAWSVHDFIPSDICIGVDTGGNGGGVCGFNSLCSVGSGTDARTICECPSGYSFVDPADRMSGCKPDFALQSCDPQSQDPELFEFVEFQNTNWPYADYRTFEPVDEERCRRDCLADCFCAVAIYTGERCWKKALPLINGRTHPTIPVKALVKKRKNNATNMPIPNNINCPSTSTSSTALIISGSILIATSVLMFLLSSFLLFHFYFNRKNSIINPPLPSCVNTIRSFRFQELQEATNGFEDVLGRGACSTVYKGAIKDNGKVVAVKKLNRIAEQSDPEFQAEVRSISRTNHRNLVQLLGYCDEGQHRILVYEFMTNGSLASFLFQNSPRPNWYTRVQIAFAIARGLCYLHEECSSPIIHCDIKPQNVLLDESYTPKIADFGLAKLLRPDQTRTFTGIRGTRGYVAPEWFRNMPITVKVDVYSYGMLLLELLCCRKNYEENVEDEREEVLADWVYDCYKVGALDVLVAGDEEAKSDMKMFERFVWIAMWCVQEDPTVRPQMKRVMHMLEGSIQVPAPPDPTAFIT